MRQVELSKPSALGRFWMVVWIPDSLAVEGRALAIAGEDGWRVEAVYNRLPDEEVHQQAHRHGCFGSIAGARS